MEVHLTPEQEALLSKIASRTGKPAEEVVKQTISRMLEDEDRFVEAVQKGFASLDRGEYISHEEMSKRIERILQS